MNVPLRTDIVDIRVYPVPNRNFEKLFSDSGSPGKDNPEDGVVKK